MAKKETMPKLKLEFDTYEEQEEYYNAINGDKYRYLLQNLDSWLRDIVKHNAYDNTPEEQEFAGKVRDKLRELLEEDNLKL
jgi:hypothetical protein